MIGQLCIKLSGREAGHYCVIIDKIDDKFVLVDGNVRRRKCNLSHLEFLDRKLSIKKTDSSDKIHELLKEAGLKTTIPREKKKNEITKSNPEPKTISKPKQSRAKKAEQ